MPRNVKRKGLTFPSGRAHSHDKERPVVETAVLVKPVCARTRARAGKRRNSRATGQWLFIRARAQLLTRTQAAPCARAGSFIRASPRKTTHIYATCLFANSRASGHISHMKKLKVRDATALSEQRRTSQYWLQESHYWFRKAALTAGTTGDPDATLTALWCCEQCCLNGIRGRPVDPNALPHRKD